MSTRPSRTGTEPQRGFTLIELMVTLAVLSVLIMVAAPAFRDAMMNVRMSALTNDLMADLALARSEAIKRGVPVLLCPSTAGATACGGTNWEVGWMVFVDADDDGTRDDNVDELILRQRETAQAGTTVRLAPAASATHLPYRPTGVTNISAMTLTFTLCDGRTGVANRGRVIAISPTGRPVVTRTNGC